MWRERAACQGTNPEEWFPTGSTDPQEVRELKRLCSECPVRTECLQYALDHGEGFGVWGGLTELERRRLLRGYQSPTLAPCGTAAAFQRHVRHGETPCDACREARNREAREYAKVRVR